MNGEAKPELIVFADASDLGWGVVGYKPAADSNIKSSPGNARQLDFRALAPHLRSEKSVPDRTLKTGLTPSLTATSQDLQRRHLPAAAVEAFRSSGTWTARQSAHHITVKEGWALSFAAQIAAKCLSTGGNVLLITDSVAARAAFQRGSSKPLLNWSVQEGRKMLALAGCSTTVMWTPTKLNPADLPSRNPMALTDKEDWMLRPQLFRWATRKLGLQPNLDLFATRANRLTPEFISREVQPAAMDCNALSLNWKALQEHHRLWANPPFSILLEVLQKIKRERLQPLLLVAPRWTSARWRPLLLELSVAHVSLKPTSPIYIRHGTTLAPPPRWTTEVHLVSGGGPGQARA